MKPKTLTTCKAGTNLKISRMRNTPISLMFLTVCIIDVCNSGCNGLSKMMKDASKISYSVKPNPMQDNGDSVDINITAQYPANYFNKKAVVMVTPTLKFADGSTQALKPVTLVGENATQSGIKISFKQGGSLNYTDKIAYLPQMKNDELDADATIENNKKNLPPVKIADGTIATVLLLQKDAKPILGNDEFTKTSPEKDTTRIFYTISNSYVRPAQMYSMEMKKFKEFVNKGIKEGYKFDNITMSAFASPDGPTGFNDRLAVDRSNTAENSMFNLFKNVKGEKNHIKFGTGKEFYVTDKTGMDWEGFRNLVQKSDIKDRDLILRVLSMYTDHDQRMKEIKNMSATYTELADGILPRLRRSIMVLNAEKKSRSDDEIKQLVSANPGALSVEEILYAATLTNDINQKLNIYKTAQRQYPGDWRGFNNSAYEEIIQNELGAAKYDLDKAAQLSPSNPVIENNMGVIAFLSNDLKTAMTDFKKASPEGNDVLYNIGLVDIKQGNYSDAVLNMSSVKSFNTALAMLLNNDVQGAQATLDASGNRSATAYYLKAIISARNGNKSDVLSNLQIAFNQDASLKKMASVDCEFIKFKTDADFKSLIGSAL